MLYLNTLVKFILPEPKIKVKPKCLYPFIFLEFHSQGDVYCCCPAWTKAGPVGNIYKQSLEQIWNGKKIQDIRKQIYHGNYKAVCNLNYCPYIKSPVNWTKTFKTANLQLKRILKQIVSKKTVLTTFPYRISLAHSGECNLRCKMCLSHADFNPPEPKLNKIIFKKVLPKLLPNLRFIKLGGNGDVFSQKETLEFLQSFNHKKYPKLKFEILTNGILLNNKMWNTIKHNKFHYINISVDAASKKTYEKIRIGGKWETLQKNLKMLAYLRKKGKIDNFFINFTVMKSNYKKIKDFVKLGEKLKVDKIYFNKIFGFRNLQDLEENINLPPNPNILSKIKKIIKNPVFNSNKVDITKIIDYKKTDFSKLNFWLYKPKLLALKTLKKILNLT
jgi:MoaA/NifB/PqqE/SkfB family radical SAM enzyme